jgi:hypothetical protein
VVFSSLEKATVQFVDISVPSGNREDLSHMGMHESCRPRHRFVFFSGRGAVVQTISAPGILSIVNSSSSFVPAVFDAADISSDR